MRALVTTSLAVLALAFAPRAAAFERQHHLGVDAGLTLLSAGDAPHVGLSGGGGAHYTYGLSDAFNFVAEAQLTIEPWGSVVHDPKTPHTLPGSLFGAGAGVVYVLDVLRWVPYGGALVGASALGGGNLNHTLLLPDAQLALGLDYAITRQWVVGAAYRQHFFATKMDTYPSYATLFLRAEYVWGW